MSYFSGDLLQATNVLIIAGLVTFTALGTSASELWDQPEVLEESVAYAALLYAAEPSYDPFEVVTLAAAPVELSQLYAGLDTRLPPSKIQKYSKDLQSKKTTAPYPSTFEPGSPEDKIIQFIRRFEAGSRGYNAVWNGNRSPLPDLPTNMSVCEVRDWQIAAARIQASTAIGLYQIVGGTFRKTLAEMQLPCDTIFDAHTQDRMGLHLLYGRYWAEFKSGDITVEDFAFELAGEWAAFPAPYGKNKGKSRYNGIAGNAHMIELPAYLSFLHELRKEIFAGGIDQGQSPNMPELTIDIQAVAALTALNTALFGSEDTGRSPGVHPEVIKVVSFSEL